MSYANKEDARAYHKAYDARPEARERRKEHSRRRVLSGENAKYLRAYSRRPQRKTYWVEYRASVKGRAKQLVKAAQARHVRLYGGDKSTFAPTWQAVAAQIEAGCSVSGLPFDLTAKPAGEKKRQRWNGPSLDRIDSAGGYTEGNWRVVLHAVNAALGTWGDDVLKIIAAAIDKRA